MNSDEPCAAKEQYRRATADKLFVLQSQNPTPVLFTSASILSVLIPCVVPNCVMSSPLKIDTEPLVIMNVNEQIRSEQQQQQKNPN